MAVALAAVAGWQSVQNDDESVDCFSEDLEDEEGHYHEGEEGGDDSNMNSSIRDTQSDVSMRDIREARKKHTLLGDILSAIYDARYAAPIFAAFAAFLLYQITIAPYSDSNSNAWKDQMAIDSRPFGLIRPNLTDHEMLYIHRVCMYAETSFELPLPSYDTIKIRFQTSVSDHGNDPPPDIFFQGVTFGITSQNPYNLEYTGQMEFASEDLYTDLLNMHPRPTTIMKRLASYNQTRWTESGYAVHFSYSDLLKSGKLSSDRRQPWKRVVDDVIEIARDYKQVYITVWYPHAFGQLEERPTTSSLSSEGTSTMTTSGDGSQTTNDNLSGTRTIDLENDEDDVYAKHIPYAKIVKERKHESTVILQEIIPTRTGLGTIQSSTVVWLSAVNGSEPGAFPPQIIYQQAQKKT